MYVEHQHGLPVPFDELQSCARPLEGMHVASPEHLLILKLSAAKDREGSAKGEKDKRDIIRIIQTIEKDSARHPEILGRFLTDDDWKKIESIINDVRLTDRISGGNSFNAKALRSNLQTSVTVLQNESELSLKSGLGQLPRGRAREAWT